METSSSRPGRRAAIASLAALAAGGAMARTPDDRVATVFAAASLQTALDAVIAAFRRETGRAVRVSYASSSALARQIEQAAPADIFISADTDWMDWAEARGLIRKDSRVSLFSTHLVLVEPAALPPTALTIAPGFPLAAALGDGRIATGAPDFVPAGRYARAALTSLGVWENVSARIAGADNVRAALALVARGEARFGIVYATDARAEPRVRVVGAFAAGSHPPIVYPAALVVRAGAGWPVFFDYLRSPAAAAIFVAEGFTVLR
jgi:molybdate transport system substrate-binding protein